MKFKHIYPGLILLFIIGVSAFLRLYNIRDYIVFLGDQGRDVLIAKRIIIDHKFTLLGPTASVGGFYLGPFYYYLMTIPLWLSRLDPVGPAIMVALFGLATVFIIYLFLKRAINPLTGYVGAFLFGISPMAVFYNRFSWNPNTLPFFSLLYFYFFYLFKEKKQKVYIFLAGLILGICLQLHYLAFCLLPLSVFFLVVKKAKDLFLNFLIFFCSIFISISPFIVFEIRHGFNNIESIIEFITRKNGALGIYPLSLIGRLLELSQRIWANILGIDKNIFSMTIVFFSLIILIIGAVKSKNKEFYKTILIWWIGGIFLLSFYQGTIYDYYYGFLFCLPPITVSLGINYIYKGKLFFKLLAYLLIAYLSINSLLKQPIMQTPNKILDQTQRISDSIIKESGGKPFNFALISAGNSDHAYRYFLEINGFAPVPLENQVTEQLFVVCESQSCEPLGHPLWEIAAYGRADIQKVWKDRVGITVYKLGHHPDSLDWIGKPAPKGI